MGKHKRNRVTLDSAPLTERPTTVGIFNDSYANIAAKFGISQDNLTALGGYDFNPISRNRLLLEQSYRGSWIVRQAVDVIPDDMTREGIEIESELSPDDMDSITESMHKKETWKQLKNGLSWAKLYGGALVVILIDGQDLATPLRRETVKKGAFKGLKAIDRWMVTPSLSQAETICEYGPNMGLPVKYTLTVDFAGMPLGDIHHSRVLRFEGDNLPHWQKQMENGWGISVLEPLYDRLLAFDSTTTGVAQLVFKAYLRTLKIPQLRQLITSGGPLFESVKKQLENIRFFQSTEGLTLVDGDDEFETHSFSFGGLSDVLAQFGEQLSGALGIPLVRLFGQSPAGLNSSGESDLRNFYDRIKKQQEDDLRGPLTILLDLEHRSTLGRPPDKGFNFSFNPLWQNTEETKADIGVKITGQVTQAFEAGLVDKGIAVKELRQASKVTGVWSNITDEDVEAAELEPPPMAVDPMTGQPIAPTVAPGALAASTQGSSIPPASTVAAAIGKPALSQYPGEMNRELDMLHIGLHGSDLGRGKANGRVLENLEAGLRQSSLNKANPHPSAVNASSDLEDLESKLQGVTLRPHIPQAKQMYGDE